MRVFKPSYSKPLPEGAKILKRKDGRWVQFRKKSGELVEGKLTKKGDRVLMETELWHIGFFDNRQIERDFVGFTDRAATQAAADKLQTLLNCLASQQPLPDDINKWIEVTPLKNKLFEFGLIDLKRSAAGKPLAEHVAEFETWLKTTKSKKYGYIRNKSYVQGTCSRIRQVFSACKFAYWSNIDQHEVEKYLGGLDIAAKTYNYYITAIRQFCAWMVEANMASKSPLKNLKRVKVDNDEYRRALTFEEVCNLLTATEKAPTRFGMIGHARAALYLLAIETGLRVRELQSLKVSSFDFDNCTVTVEAESCKDRKKAVQLLKLKRAAQLKEFFEDRIPDENAFNMPANYDTADMIKADLDDASILYENELGRCDFHALRHTFATELDRSGASLKERMAITRHSDKSNLTLGTYTHVRIYDLRQAIERLPDYPWPGSKQQSQVLIATGTDDRLSPACFTGGQIGKQANTYEQDTAPIMVLQAKNKDVLHTHNPLVQGSNPCGPNH